MTNEQKAAFIISQSVCALAEIEGMKVFNKERKQRGESIGYSEEAFLGVPAKYGIDQYAVKLLFK